MAFHNRNNRDNINIFSFVTINKLIMMRYGYAWICALLAAISLTGNAYAQSNSGTVSITVIRTGWGSDTFAIETGQAIVNPARCSAPDAYMAGISEPGYKTHYAAALLAFSTGKNLTVIISDTECTGGRPRIIGLHVQK